LRGSQCPGDLAIDIDEKPAVAEVEVAVQDLHTEPIMIVVIIMKERTDMMIGEAEMLTMNDIEHIGIIGRDLDQGSVII